MNIIMNCRFGFIGRFIARLVIKSVTLSKTFFKLNDNKKDKTK